MDSQRSGKSHATAGLLAVVAVPVLYVVTFPIVDRIVINQTFPHTLFTNGSALLQPLPRWFTMYAAPYNRLKTGSLKKPLETYEKWVARRF